MNNHYLDVDRLAAATRAAFPNIKSYGGDDCDCRQTDATLGSTTCFGHDRHDFEARAIAVEYDRLADAPSESATSTVESPWADIELPVRYDLPRFDPVPGLDEGIEGWVNLLRYHGIETCQSCIGGAGHAYPEPTIEFLGNPHIGWWVVAVATMAKEMDGLRPYRLDRSWHLEDGDPVDPVWRLVLIQAERP